MNNDTNHMSVVWTYCSCKGIGKYVRDSHAWLLKQHAADNRARHEQTSWLLRYGTVLADCHTGCSGGLANPHCNQP